VPAVAELTVSQKIILAAYHLEEEGNTPFSAEALIVAAWKESPSTFGLKGFVEQYPDANRVLACIMGERGLARRGWLVKMGQKLYTLSRQGREEAKRVLEGDDSPMPKRRALAQIKVPKELENHLVGLLNAKAVRLFKTGMKREITYIDAKQFWGLADNVHGEALDEVVGKVPAAIEEVEKLVIGDSVELSSGMVASQEDLKMLAGVHRFLKEQFTRNLTQQRDRGRRF
jgi:hypothetical protein